MSPRPSRRMTVLVSVELLLEVDLAHTPAAKGTWNGVYGGFDGAEASENEVKAIRLLSPQRKPLAPEFVAALDPKAIPASLNREIDNAADDAAEESKGDAMTARGPV